MIENNTTSSFLSQKRAAQTTGISETFLRRLVKQGKIPGFYTGNRFMVNVPMLIELLNSPEGLASLSDKEA